MHCEAKDDELDQLLRRLQEFAPDVEPAYPIIIEPSDDDSFERIVHVISAIRRAGIRDYELR
ncbi:MAG TPA: hypothetical protein VGO11_23355 [Chthoniobacteraceae bacterium]|nr:hypothetical protein [Chthoniobacteraceae bacterium]